MTFLAHEKPILEVEQTLERLREQNKHNSLWSQDEMAKMEKKLEQLKSTIYSSLKPWERVSICRHPQRPHTIDYIENICDEFVELFGDRTFQDDAAIIGGFAKINGQKFMIIGQEKGKDTESRIKRNFGMPHPEGYRKAMRLMQLAEKFEVPIVCLIDTPGAYPGLSAEERGQGWAIAKNLFDMSQLKTPIVVVIIGEGCSGGALGIGIGDSIGMLEHSYYSVISPEGCSSILWKDGTKNATAAAVLKMQSEDLLQMGIIDQVIKEPLGGAHFDPAVAFDHVKSFILQSYESLSLVQKDLLVENRYQKFRKMGKFESVHNMEVHEIAPSRSPS